MKLSFRQSSHCGRRRAFSAALALFVSASFASAAILEYADYEGNYGTGDSAVRDGFYSHEKSSGALFEARAPVSGDPSPRAGSGLVYMEIHTSDGDYGSTGGKRIELKMNQDGSELTPYASTSNGLGIFGDTFWYAWSVYIPTSHVNDGKQIMGQWICRWIENGSTRYNPPIALDLENGTWILTVKTDRNSTTGQVKFNLGAVTKGQWTDWAFQIKWDRPNSSDDNTGYIRVYRNGTLLDNATVTTGSYNQNPSDGYTHTGANAYTATSADEAPNFKLGIYKRTSETWSASTRYCYYDEIRVGSGSETLATLSPGGSGGGGGGGDASPIGPVADSFTFGGNVSQNNGTATLLGAKDGSGTAYDRTAFLKFDLSGLSSSPTTATLLLEPDAGTQAGTVYARTVANDAWTETGITWSNQPAIGATNLASAAVAAGQTADISLNISAYIQQEFAGDKIATVALTGNDAQLYFKSRETGSASRPTLVFTGGGGTVPQILSSVSALAVTEGGTAQFQVSLSSAPAANVVVSVARTSGDADLSVSTGASLTFTPTNYATPQTVTLAAAQDADTTNGSATFLLSASGLTGVNVTATESDNDVPPLVVIADTYATNLSGQTGTNFGSAATVEAKDDGSSTASFDRIGYLKFDLSGLSSQPTQAILELSPDSTTQAGTLTVNQLTQDAWSETGLTWSNRPAHGTTLGSVTLAAGSTVVRTLDVTAYVQAQWSGDSAKIASFALTGDNAILKLRSREVGAPARLLLVGGN